MCRLPPNSWNLLVCYVFVWRGVRTDGVDQGCAVAAGVGRGQGHQRRGQGQQGRGQDGGFHVGKVLACTVHFFKRLLSGDCGDYPNYTFSSITSIKRHTGKYNSGHIWRFLLSKLPLSPCLCFCFSLFQKLCICVFRPSLRKVDKHYNIVNIHPSGNTITQESFGQLPVHARGCHDGVTNKVEINNFGFSKKGPKNIQQECRYLCLIGQMVWSNARRSCINESKRDFVCNVVQKRLRLAGQVPFLLFFF